MATSYALIIPGRSALLFGGGVRVANYALIHTSAFRDGLRCCAAGVRPHSLRSTQLFCGGVQSIQWQHMPLFLGGLRCYSVAAYELFRGMPCPSVYAVLLL